MEGVQGLFGRTLDHWAEDADSPGLEWQPRETGAMGYRQALQRGGVTILFDGSEDMGIHVRVSGDGCRQLEAEGVVTDWRESLSWWLTCGAHVSRLDVAADDRAESAGAGVLCFAKMKQAVRDRHYTCRSSRFRFEESGDHNKPGGLGETIYLGERSSQMFVRIYNKAAEQLQDGGEVAFPHWLRVEAEFKKEKAHAMALRIASEGLDAFAGVLRSHLAFREPTENEQRARWPVADWWLCFLNHAARAPISLAPLVRTVEETVEWVARQVAPSLAVIVNATGYGWEKLRSLVGYGERRFRSRHLDPLIRHNTMKGATA